MVAQPIQLTDYADDPRGRRYTDAEKEIAYQTWRTVAGRSLRKTGEALDISVSTLGTWHQRDGWADRSKREDDEEAETVRLSIRSKALIRSHAAMDVIEKIMNDDTASPRDRLQAAFWMAGLSGYAPVTKAETSVFTQVQPAPPAADTVPQIDNVSTLTRADLLERERQRRAARSRSDS